LLLVSQPYSNASANPKDCAFSLLSNVGIWWINALNTNTNTNRSTWFLVIVIVEEATLHWMGVAHRKGNPGGGVT